MNEQHAPVALVTGGARRIGAAIARTLHGAGYRVAIHYRGSASDAEALQADLVAERSGSAVLFQGELNDTRHLPDLVQGVADWGGGLDVLVNNASSFYPTPMGRCGEDDWEALMGPNLKAPFFLAQAAAPYLRASGGCIVNLGDIHGERPLKEHPVYSIAKAGNLMMTRALARELGPEVRVNGVSPGAILWPESEMDEVRQQRILSRTALKRQGSPGDIARTVLFLVRDAPYVTGQVIAVDGGRTLSN